MISKRLENTKPINLIIAILALLVGYLLYEFLIFNRVWGIFHFFEVILTAFVLLLSMYFLNIIVRWNELTETQNSYAIFFFAIFLMLFPKIFKNTYLVLSNLLIIVATWRVLTLKTGKNVPQKIFDASFLILCAGLLNVWALWFLLNIWISLLFYGSKKKKYWFIPLLAVFCVSILTTTVLLVLGKSLPFSYFNFLPKYDDAQPFSFPMLVSIVITAIMFTTSLVVYFFKAKYHSASSQVIIQFLVVGLATVFFSQEAIFIFAPLSILFALYVEKIERIWLKESVLCTFLALPLVLLLLHYVTQNY